MRTFTVVAMALVAAVSYVTPVAGAEPEPQAATRPVAQLVGDIDPVAGSEPRDLTRAAGLVFFSADDGAHGRELWASDGTEAGAMLVRDIRPGGKGSSPRHLTRVGHQLYFSADDGAHGRELWVSDGTKPGTKMVKDATSGPGSTAISEIADGAGLAYFTRAHRDLWRSDGTARGTSLLRRFSGVTVDAAPVLGKALIFSADDGLWRSDGTTPGTRRVSPVFWALDGLTRFRDRVYFRADPPLGPFGGIPELWSSNGTKVGTKRLGPALNPTDLTVMGNRLYFNARKSESRNPRLYHIDGIVSGPAPVSPRVRPLNDMAAAAGHLWAIDGSRGRLEPDRLWVSDGTAPGTLLLHEGLGEWSVYDWDGPGHVGLDGRLWFAAGPLAVVGDAVDATDSEVWSSDGTISGTLEAADVNADGSSFPRELVKLGRTLLFSADDGIHGRELWALTP